MLYSNLELLRVCLGVVVMMTSLQDCGALVLHKHLACLTVLLDYPLLCLSFLSLSIHSAMDAFAQTLMKDAVNCDKHSDLQNSVNQLDFEYGLCCRGCPCKHTFSMYLALCTALHTVLSAHQGI